MRRPRMLSYGPVMPDVADERGAAGQDLLVGGRDVRVRAEHGADAALEVVGEQVLVGGRLGVDIDDDASTSCRQARPARGRRPGTGNRPAA